VLVAECLFGLTTDDILDPPPSSAAITATAHRTFRIRAVFPAHHLKHRRATPSTQLHRLIPSSLRRDIPHHRARYSPILYHNILAVSVHQANPIVPSTAISQVLLSLESLSCGVSSSLVVLYIIHTSKYYGKFSTSTLLPIAENRAQRFATDHRWLAHWRLRAVL